jgi:hypothetical protein
MKMSYAPYPKLTYAEIEFFRKTGRFPPTITIEPKAKDLARTGSDQISKKRQKRTAEIFTPPALIKEMLDQLPEELWQSGKTIFEPAAGDGNFVVAILERKLLAGCTPTEAIQDVYAVEYMLDNVLAMKRRVLEIVGDTSEHRKIVDEHIAYANTLDKTDISDGRCFPEWLKN